MGDGHTPDFAGPWFFSDVKFRWDMVDRRNIYDANREFVCMVKAPSPVPTARDIALLAVPELLAAAQDALRTIKAFDGIIGNVEERDNPWNETVRTLRAAISRATAHPVAGEG